MKRPLFPTEGETATQREIKRQNRQDVEAFSDMLSSHYWAAEMAIADANHTKWMMWQQHNFLQEARWNRLQINAVCREVLKPLMFERELVDQVLSFL